jgi:hypothetical protein
MPFGGGSDSPSGRSGPPIKGSGPSRDQGG